MEATVNPLGSVVNYSKRKIVTIFKVINISKKYAFKSFKRSEPFPADIFNNLYTKDLFPK